MLLFFILFLAIWYRMGRRQAADPMLRELSEETEAGPLPSIPAAVAFVVAGLALLLAGGKLSETGAVTVARWLGLSDALIGLTIVAFATSLPELATSFMAVRKGVWLLVLYVGYMAFGVVRELV